MNRNLKDVAAGAFFMAAGAFFCLNAWLTLQIGSAFRMGPGYFPVVLGIILFGLGAAILVSAAPTSDIRTGPFSVRGLILTALAPVLFGALVQGFGLLPALLLSTFAAAMASRRVGVLFAVLLTVGLTAFCILVFSYGLNLPMRLFGPALRHLWS